MSHRPRPYVRSAVIGFSIAAGFSAVLVGFDVAGLGASLLGSAEGGVWALGLVVGLGVIFSAVQYAFEAHAHTHGHDGDDDTPRGGGGHRGRGELVPVPIKVQRDPRRR